MVREYEVAERSCDCFCRLKEKIKKTKNSLTKWSREKFGDVFKQLIIREEILIIKEALFEEYPLANNRIILGKAQAEFKTYIHYE